MHHMSCVRKDYESMKSKLENSPNKYIFKKYISKYLYYFNYWKYPSPALNIHQFIKNDINYKNVKKIDEPINLSVKYSPKKKWNFFSRIIGC